MVDGTDRTQHLVEFKFDVCNNSLMIVLFFW